MHVAEKVARPRHGRLGHHARHVARRPALPRSAVRELPFGVRHARERSRRCVEGAARRTEEHVVRHRLPRVALQVLEIAEVVGEEVRAGVVRALDQLQDVARLELREPDHPRADVVIEAVPGLGEVPLAVRLAL